VGEEEPLYPVEVALLEVVNVMLVGNWPVVPLPEKVQTKLPIESEPPFALNAILGLANVALFPDAPPAVVQSILNEPAVAWETAERRIVTL
jgi:hypothetical protein